MFHISKWKQKWPSHRVKVRWFLSRQLKFGKCQWWSAVFCPGSFSWAMEGRRWNISQAAAQSQSAAAARVHWGGGKLHGFPCQNTSIQPERLNTKATKLTTPSPPICLFIGAFTQSCCISSDTTTDQQHTVCNGELVTPHHMTALTNENRFLVPGCSCRRKDLKRIKLGQWWSISANFYCITFNAMQCFRPLHIGSIKFNTDKTPKY